MRTLALSTALLAACGSGTGTVQFTIWGEEGATQGFPNDELSLVDGWAISFDHWVTSVGGIELADAREQVVFADDGRYVVDLVAALDPRPIVDAELEAARYKVSYSFVPPAAGATELGPVDGAIVAEMIANGWNTFVEGRATKSGETVTFRWGMRNPARYQFCRNGIDDTDGVAVPDGGEVEAGIFVHVDHLFWDRLGTEEAELRFDAIAGWKDATGAVPFDDLQNAMIANLRDRGGAPILDANGQPLRYDDAGLGYPRLRDFIAFSTSQQAHLNGEGRCTRIPQS